jgi:hypothetical protein
MAESVFTPETAITPPLAYKNVPACPSLHSSTIPLTPAEISRVNHVSAFK